MTEENLRQLIKEDRYQVFVMASKVPLPLPYGIHCWFVINLRGEVHRWEFGQFVNSPHKHGIGLLKDFLKPTKGMNKYAWSASPRWTSFLIQSVEGDENSEVAKLARFINERSEDYPLKDMYVLLGPNSNTYMGWVLKKFPQVGLKLPSNALGKAYNVEMLAKRRRK